MAGFDFNDARPLPFLSAPASPRRFGDLTLSAPTSPGRVADFYRSFENFSEYDGGGVPFHWEEKPGTPKSPPKKLPSFKDEDFAFDFSADLEESSLTAADELFDGGKIRPLKLPPRLLQVEEIKSPLIHSPRSPRSPRVRAGEGPRGLCPLTGFRSIHGRKRSGNSNSYSNKNSQSQSTICSKLRLFLLLLLLQLERVRRGSGDCATCCCSEARRKGELRTGTLTESMRLSVGCSGGTTM